MAYFIETLSLNESDLRALSTGMNQYSIVHQTLPEVLTSDARTSFLEQVQSPFVRLCMQRVLSRIQEESTWDLNRVSKQFYAEQVLDMFHDLMRGSDEFNRHFLVHQMKEQLKKNKELPEKLYRQMVKEKWLRTDPKTKQDTEKKKIIAIVHSTNDILKDNEDRQKQEQLVGLLAKDDV
jgi:hemerythrin superfamily protein